MAVALCLFMAAMVTACGKDDEPGNTSKVEGTWVGDDYDSFYSNVRISFDSNGTGTATIDHYGAYSSSRVAYFTYKVKGNTVTTKGTMASANSDGDSDTQDFNNTYKIDGNILKVQKGNSWYTSSVRSYRRSY